MLVSEIIRIESDFVSKFHPAFRSRRLIRSNPEGIHPPARCKRSNPNGVASKTGLSQRSKTGSTLSGLRINFLLPQGWLKNAKPGLEDKIPSGFMLVLSAKIYR